MMAEKRLYELWPSKNRFFLKGLFITGPKSNSPVAISLQIALLLVLSLYSYFIAPVMLDLSLILFIAFFATYTATIIFMLLTSMRDPGAIPPRPFLQHQQRQLQNMLRHNYEQLLSLYPYQRIIYLLYQTSDPSQIFCCSCHIYRPASASHCSRCDSCYFGMDHHCPWLGTCVAKNNYWTFLEFLASLIGLIVVIGVNLLVYVDYETGNGGEGSDWTTYVVVCWVVVGGLLVVIAGFLLFHIVLLWKRKTTIQFLKERRNKSSSPYKWRSSQNKKSNTIQAQTLQHPLISQNFQQALISQTLQQSLISQSKVTIDKNQDKNQLIQQQDQTNGMDDQQKPTVFKVSQRFLDDYISSLYRQTSTFYSQLFNPRNAIHLVDFRQKLSAKQVEFIQKGLADLQDKRNRMKSEGARFQYHKQVIAE